MENSLKKEEVVSLALIGHTDHGKSTLIGQLMLLTGSIPLSKEKYEEIQDFKDHNFELYEYILRHLSERQMEINVLDTIKKNWMKKPSYATQEIIQEKKEEARTQRTQKVILNIGGLDKTLYILDTPGTTEYLKQWIKGVRSVDYALFLLSANEREFQNVFEEDATTGNNLFLLLDSYSLDSIIFCINLMDDKNRGVAWSQESFNKAQAFVEKTLKEYGITLKNQFFIPISALLGDNIKTKSEKMDWYEGNTLIEVMKEISQKRKISQLSNLRIILGKKNRLVRSNALIYEAFIESGELHKSMKKLYAYHFPPGYSEVYIKKLFFLEEEIPKAETSDFINIQCQEKYEFLTNGTILCNDNKSLKIGNYLKVFTTIKTDSELTTNSFYTTYINENNYKCQLIKQYDPKEREDDIFKYLELYLPNDYAICDNVETNPDSSLTSFLLLNSESRIIAIGKIKNVASKDFWPLRDILKQTIKEVGKRIPLDKIQPIFNNIGKDFQEFFSRITLSHPNFIKEENYLQIRGNLVVDEFIDEIQDSYRTSKYAS